MKFELSDNIVQQFINKKFHVSKFMKTPKLSSKFEEIWLSK